MAEDKIPDSVKAGKARNPPGLATDFENAGIFKKNEEIRKKRAEAAKKKKAKTLRDK